MMLIRLAAAVALLAGGICTALATSAQADDEPIRTVYWDHAQFKHGAPFQIECASGSYLVGFEGRAGAWIDNLRIICARWDAERGKLEQPALLEGKQIGWSQGGEPTRKVCPVGDGIAGVYDEHYSRNDSAYVLHTLEFHCVGAADGTRPLWRIFGSTSPIATGWKDPQPHAGCPEGYLATGIYGRSGEFIDKFFGWVCQLRPIVSPATATKVTDAAKSKSYNSKWAVGGTRRVGNDIVGGGVDIVAGGDAPPSPTVAMAETTNDTDVYRRVVKNDVVSFERTDDDPAHFLPRGFGAPLLAKEGGWWKLDLKNVDFVKGEGWVAADQLKMK